MTELIGPVRRLLGRHRRDARMRAWLESILDGLTEHLANEME